MNGTSSGDSSPSKKQLGETDATKRAVLVTSAVTAFLSPFAISAVNIALPSIQAQFGIDAVSLSWISTAYLLATAVVLIPAGKIGDVYGRKRMLAAGVALFSLGTLAAMAAESFGWLIFSRVLQGAGGAFMVSTGLAILSSVFPPGERGRALGFNVAAVYVGSSAGPFLGGWLTDSFGWPSVFAANAVVGFLALATILLFIRGEWSNPDGNAPDAAGSAIYGASVIGLLFGLSSLPSVRGVLLLLAGGSLFALFVRRMRASADPLFDVRLFSENRGFALSSVAALLNYAAVFATAFLLSLYLQYIHGMAPDEAGLVLVLQPVLQALVSPLAGRLSDRVEARVLASIGMALTAAGLALLALLGERSSMLLVWVALGLLGIGFGLFSSPNMNAIMSSVDNRFYGQASGAVGTMRLLGQMGSMAVASLVFALFLEDQPIVPSLYPLFVQSMRICFTVNALFCVVGIWCSLARGSLRPENSDA